MPIDLSYVLEMNAADRSQRKYSSLDLCAHDAFTIIVGSCGHSYEQALNVNDLGSIPIKVVVFGRDFCVEAGPQGKAWLDATGLEGGTVLVVRPDQHILTIFNSDSSIGQAVCAIQSHLS